MFFVYKLFYANLYFVRELSSLSSLSVFSVRRSSKIALFLNGSECEPIIPLGTTRRDATGEELSSDSKVEELAEC